MATPVFTTHSIPGRLGPIAFDLWSDGGSSDRPVVIVVHGFKGFKDWGFFPKISERLARAGFSVVNMTMSGAGVDRSGRFVHPERFGHNTFSAELFDLEAVLDFLDSGGMEIPRPVSVGLLGHSRGGGIATLFAAAHDRIGALVTWAGISTVNRWDEGATAAWRKAGRMEVTNTRTGEVLPLFTDLLEDLAANGAALDIASAAAGLTIPWLIAHGEEDETVSIAEGKKLAEWNGTAATLWIPGAGHTFGVVHPWAGPSAASSRLFDETVAHFSRYLG